MATIFFFNGQPKDFDDRLKACLVVFNEQNFCPAPQSCHTADNFVDLYTEFIRNNTTTKICFLHFTKLRSIIMDANRDQNLCIPREDRECVYVVWFSGGSIPIENTREFCSYFPNSIFAPPTEDEDDPSDPEFWWTVSNQIKNTWGEVL